MLQDLAVQYEWGAEEPPGIGYAMNSGASR